MVSSNYTISQDGARNVFMWTISWHLQENMYHHMSFEMDSGAIDDFILTPEIAEKLRNYKRILVGENKLEYIELQGPDGGTYKASVHSNKHVKTNIIGLKFLQTYGFHVQNGSWTLDCPLTYL